MCEHAKLSQLSPINFITYYKCQLPFPTQIELLDTEQEVLTFPETIICELNLSEMKAGVHTYIHTYICRIYIN